jgi:hypothetical protein
MDQQAMPIRAAAKMIHQVMGESDESRAAQRKIEGDITSIKRRLDQIDPGTFPAIME